MVWGLIKHYATSYNLQKSLEEAIPNTNDFVKYVQNYTNVIKIIAKRNIEKYRKTKNVELLATPKYPEIPKTHLLINP